MVFPVLHMPFHPLSASKFLLTLSTLELPPTQRRLPDPSNSTISSHRRAVEEVRVSWSRAQCLVSLLFSVSFPRCMVWECYLRAPDGATRALEGGSPGPRTLRGGTGVCLSQKLAPCPQSLPVHFTHSPGTLSVDRSLSRRCIWWQVLSGSLAHAWWALWGTLAGKGRAHPPLASSPPHPPHF